MKKLMPLFFEPPLYVLPDDLRMLIKEQIEIADAEWMKKHTFCESKESSDVDTQDIWGKGCKSCFSDISWHQIVGELEFSMGAFKLLHRRKLEDTDAVRAAIRQQCRDLKSTTQKLQKTILSCWHLSFPRRTEFLEQLEGIEKLEESLKSLLTSCTKQAKREKKLKLSSPAERAAFGLVSILSETLIKAGFSCEIITIGEGVRIASPGLRILRECLHEVEIEMDLDELLKWANTP